METVIIFVFAVVSLIIALYFGRNNEKHTTSAKNNTNALSSNININNHDTKIAPIQKTKNAIGGSSRVHQRTRKQRPHKNHRRVQFSPIVQYRMIRQDLPVAMTSTPDGIISDTDEYLRTTDQFIPQQPPETTPQQPPETTEDALALPQPQPPPSLV